MRASVLRAPVFLGSLTRQTERCAPPPPDVRSRCFLFILENKKNNYFQQCSGSMTFWCGSPTKNEFKKKGFSAYFSKIKSPKEESKFFLPFLMIVEGSGTLIPETKCFHSGPNSGRQGRISFHWTAAPRLCNIIFPTLLQHCFICHPSDSTVSEEAGIEP